jgi:sugar lactone lactonase YvrE
MHRFDAGGSTSLLTEDIAVNNGPCFSPDGTIFYCGDSWSRHIWEFDYDITTGDVSGKRLFATIDDGLAIPDGATVDAEGFVWVATFEGGEIRRYAPDGTLDRSIPMPVQPTSVMFGGPDFDVLFVTTRGQAELPGRAGPVDPLGGCVLACHGLGVRGLPEAAGWA